MELRRHSGPLQASSQRQGNASHSVAEEIQTAAASFLAANRHSRACGLQQVSGAEGANTPAHRLPLQQESWRALHCDARRDNVAPASNQ